MFRILVACIGNVCRSPLAERLLAVRLDPAHFEVTSAGVRALAGAGMDADAAAQLARLGGSAEGFVSRQVTPVMLREADLVLVATKELRSRVLEEAPGVLRRAFTLREFADLAELLPLELSPSELVARAAAERSRVAHGDLDVPDPYRRGEEAHQEAATAIAAAVETIATRLG